MQKSLEVGFIIKNELNLWWAVWRCEWFCNSEQGWLPCFTFGWTNNWKQTMTKLKGCFRGQT